MIGRIHGRASFERLRREGTRVRSGSLWCTMVVDRSLPAPSVAFAIGRAVGPAVVRNRLRRRLREILRAASLPPGLYLIGATPAAASLGFSELERHVASMLRTVR